MEKFIVGIANRQAQNKHNKIKHQSSLYQYEEEYEQHGQKDDQIQKSQNLASQLTRQTFVQIDDIMLFFLQSDLSLQTQKLIQAILQRMKKTEDIQAKLLQFLNDKSAQSVLIMSSPYNYFRSNKKDNNNQMLLNYQKWNMQFQCELVVKNDGNTFYRCLFLDIILNIVLTQDKQKLEQTINQIMNIPNFKHNLDYIQDFKDEDIKYCAILFLLTNFQKIQNEKMFSLIDFCQNYNQNPLIDVSAVIIMRNILYQFYLGIKQSSNYRGWIDTFEHQKNHLKLLKDGTEAEQQIMVLASKAIEVKLFALTFFKTEDGGIDSELNELYMMEEDYEKKIYLIQQNQQFNLLFELEFMRKHEIYFLKFLDVNDEDQILIQFEKNGQIVKQASELEEDQAKNNGKKNILETNFFKRIQLQDPSSILKESLLQDFGFKKQIKVVGQKENQQQSLHLIDQSKLNVQELPTSNPLAKQPSYQIDFKQFLENQQIGNIENIKKQEEDQNDLTELDHIQSLIGDGGKSDQQSQKTIKKKVRMSIADINITEESHTKNEDSIQSARSILKFQKKNLVDKLDSQEAIKTLSDESDESESMQSKEEQNSQIDEVNQNRRDAVVYDLRCLDCDKYTNLEQKQVVTKILDKIIICNFCVLKKANFLQQNKLSSLNFYGVNLYRFQLLDLVRDLEYLIQNLVDTKINASLFNVKEEDSMEIIQSQNLPQKQKSASFLSNSEKQNSQSLLVADACQYCNLLNREINLKPDQESFFLKIDNFDKTKQLVICKKCLDFLYEQCENRQYMNLFQIKKTFIDPREIQYQYEKVLQQLNRTGKLIQCQFYCKIEQKTDNLACSLFDTQENKLVQRKICLECFERILNSPMNVDDFVDSSCQVQLFSTIFREDFLNNVCISCSTKQIPGKNEFSIKNNQEIQQNSPQNLYFRVTEQSEKFDSYLCLTCIKNILIDQYTQMTSTQNVIEGEIIETSRIFKILYKKIGVIFCFSYSPIINKQILKALQNEAAKDQMCFKCNTQDKKPLYFLNNKQNFSICQSCFINVMKRNKKSEIFNNLKISESTYQTLKEGMLQNSLLKGYCFCCVEFNGIQLYNIWVKNYGRVLKICETCVLQSKPYVSQDIFEVFSTFYDEKILYSPVDIPKEIVNEVNKNKQEMQVSNKETLRNQNQIDKKCLSCNEQKKKTVKMYDCQCQICMKCISKSIQQDEKDFIVCPVPYCINIYQKLKVIVYLEQLVKEEEYKIQQKKLNKKLAKQNQSKYLCNSCQRPHIPIILTKQKYCSCVLLCKQCMLCIYKSKRCYKCLESNCKISKSDLENFDENQLCCSCLDPLNSQKQNSIQEQFQQNLVNNTNKKILICGNCLYQINQDN